jgi:Tectonin domain
MEVLVYAVDPAAVREAVAAAGGRLVHALTAQLLVLSLPETLSVSSIQGASVADPAQLEGTERALAEAWLSKFGAASRAADRLAKPGHEPIPWDTPGYTPPNYLPGRAIRRSTDTPTSVVLTGSVAIGVVMVSGPPDAPPWTSVHGALKYVSVGADGTVWGVNADDKIYRWNGGSGVWDPISGALKQISVGSAANVWGVNKNDKIYRWNGSSWTQISGALKHVSIAGDGSVWGVNKDDKIYRWNGSSWTQVGGSLKQISVGSATTVWGVNSDDDIFFWNGNGWMQVAGALKHVSVAEDGSVWGVNSDDEIYRWGGSAWVQVPGALKQVSVGRAGLVWGVNNDDKIYRLR